MAGIGKKLKALRLDKKFTQEYVADTINATKSLISMYESDKRTPSRATLCKLADLYDVTTDYLVGRVKDKSYEYSVCEDAPDIYNAIPSIPLYEKSEDLIVQKPTGFATFENLLIDYNNDHLFYIKITKGKKDAWILAEADCKIIAGKTYVVKTGESLKLMPGEELSEFNKKNVMGVVRQMITLY